MAALYKPLPKDDVEASAALLSSDAEGRGPSGSSRSFDAELDEFEFADGPVSASGGKLGADYAGQTKEATLLRGALGLITLRMFACSAALYVLAPLEPSLYVAPLALVTYFAAGYGLYYNRDARALVVVPAFLLYTACESVAAGVVISAFAATFIHITEGTFIVMTGVFAGLFMSTYQCCITGFLWRVLCSSVGAALAFVLCTFIAPLDGAIGIFIILVGTIISVTIVLVDIPCMLKYLAHDEAVLGSLVLGSTTMALGMMGRL